MLTSLWFNYCFFWGESSRPSVDSSAADSSFREFSPRPPPAARCLSLRVGFDLDSEEDQRPASHGVALRCLPVPPLLPVVRLAISVLRTLRCTPLQVLTPSFSFIKICLSKMGAVSF